MKPPKRYLESLQNTLHNTFEKDQNVIMLGEDILDPYGGAFMVSKGLSQRFPERVIATPICEASIVGIGIGLALRGFRPIVEIMFSDFLPIAADQIINHATKFELMYAGQVKVPLVIRAPSGAGRGYGPTHSQSLEKFFLGIPNLNVVAPSHCHDPGAELTAAIYDDSPTLFIENKLLYPLNVFIGSGRLTVELVHTKSSVYSTAVLRNFSPKETKPDVVVVTYGGVSKHLVSLLDRFADEEIWICAVFPSCISDPPIDFILSIVNEVGRLVIIEDGTQGFGWCSEISQKIYHQAWKAIRAPITCVGAYSTVIPTSYNLEKKVIVTEEKIDEAIMEVLKW